MPPNMATNSKFNSWGCPACGTHGEMYHVPDKDMYGCSSCAAKFTGLWIEQWMGDPYPHLQGQVTGNVKINVIHPSQYEDDYDPIMDSSLGEKLLRLKEKVVAFREAVINPDRVTSDEDIEKLLHELFEVSYTLPDPTEPVLEEQTDLAPDTFDSIEAYAKQLDAAVLAGDISVELADDLYKAFGGPDPFEKDGDDIITLDMNPDAIESPDDNEWIDPYGDT